MRKRDYGAPFWTACMSSLLLGALLCFFLSGQYGKEQYRFASALSEEMFSEVSGKYELSEAEFAAVVKDSLERIETGEGEAGFLASYGYIPGNFARGIRARMLLLSGICLILFFVCIFCLYRRSGKRRRQRISELTQYLEQVDQDKAAPGLFNREDEFACLQDEIQKTVQKLTLTKEAALRDRERLSENLADISHQIKTSVTALSLQCGLAREQQDFARIDSIQKQLQRLLRMVEALLTLSRIDAGVLTLDKKPVDVYTLLELSAEAIEGLLMEKNIKIELPNHPQVSYLGDLDWSMEAFLNLLKNCAEHTPKGGRITVDYSQNPLYTEIVISDNGEGFAKEDLPHIFERFYQGAGSRHAKNGAGIGLALAKSLLELQGGFIKAENRPEGGACFTVHFYCH